MKQLRSRPGATPQERPRAAGRRLFADDLRNFGYV